MEKIKTIPFSLQTIVISSDSVSDGMKNLSKKLMPSTLEDKQANLLKNLISLPFLLFVMVNMAACGKNAATNEEQTIETATEDTYAVSEDKPKE